MLNSFWRTWLSRRALAFGLGCALCAVLVVHLYRHSPDLHLNSIWTISGQDLANLIMLLLAAVILSGLANAFLYRHAARLRSAPIGLALFGLCSFGLVALAPRPIQLTRTFALGGPAGAGQPIVAQEARYLTSPADWLRPRGKPLAVADRARTTMYLFKLEPSTDLYHIGVMSCPDSWQSRRFLVSSWTSVDLAHLNLPVGTHFPYDTLKFFCMPGVQLAPDVR